MYRHYKKIFPLLLLTVFVSIEASSNESLSQYLIELRNIKVVGGSKTGEAGVSSDFFRLFQKISKVGTKSDFIKMLKDRNAIVRCMGITILLQNEENFDLVKALEEDQEKVSFMPYGCIISEISVGRFAEEMIKNPNFFNSADTPMDFE